ncbi:hypothetical protein BH10PSE1_BH10PSE1_07720 [soil metagenome]
MILSTVFALAMFLGQAPGWTWTLYEGSGPIVLANERPDTPDLRSTLECAAGSGLVKVSLYGSRLEAGIANVSSGDSTATVETRAGTDGAVVTPLRTDHPVFARFTASGVLAVVAGSARQIIEIPAPDLAKLRRFADLCSG